MTHSTECTKQDLALVCLLVNLVPNGMSVELILKEYPLLDSEDIRQALQYAAVLANEKLSADWQPVVKYLADMALARGISCRFTRLAWRVSEE
ncbi:MAG: DUF433 domain-containing protein [Nitrospira sp.]